MITVLYHANKRTTGTRFLAYRTQLNLGPEVCRFASTGL
jgi:hypothetical protein